MDLARELAVGEAVDLAAARFEKLLLARTDLVVWLLL